MVGLPVAVVDACQGIDPSLGVGRRGLAGRSLTGARTATSRDNSATATTLAT